MVDFSWNKWLGTMTRAGQAKKARTAKIARVGQIEGLEDRALMTVAPVGVADLYVAVKDTPLVIAAGTGVLANDTDADAGQTATLQVDLTSVTQPANGTVNVSATGGFTYSPKNGVNNVIDTFTYKTVDTEGLKSAVTTVRIHLGSPENKPVGTPQTVLMNAGVAPNSYVGDGSSNLNPKLTGTDDDGDPVFVVPNTFFTAAADASDGVSTAKVVINGDGSFTITPQVAGNFYTKFTFRATDNIINAGAGAGDAAALTTVTVHVGTQNVLPTATAAQYAVALNTTLDSATAAPNAADLTVLAGHSAVLPLNTIGVPSDGDTPKDPITFKLKAGPFLKGTTTPAGGQLLLKSDGKFSYSPPTDFTGAVEFTYVVNDGTVTVNSNGDSAPATVVILVNSAPVANPLFLTGNKDEILKSAGTPAAGTKITGINLGAVDANSSAGDTLKFAVTAAATTKAGAVAVDNVDTGAFTFTPAAGFTGVDTFLYNATDSSTATNKVSANQVVVVHVGIGNNTPALKTLGVEANFKTTVGTPLAALVTGTLGTGDGNSLQQFWTDADFLLAAANGGGLEKLTFAKGAATGNEKGTVVINANGTFTYTPLSGFTGTDTFSYTVTDGFIAAPIAKTATVTVNTPPATKDISVANTGTTHLVKNLTTLGAATDANAGDAANFVYTQVGALTAGSGTLLFSGNGDFDYTPNPAFNGVASFTFKVNDGKNDSAPATSTVFIFQNVVNQKPNANTRSYSTLGGQPLERAFDGSDGAGEPAFFAITQQPASGTVVFKSTGTTTANGKTGDATFIYTPNAGVNNVTDTFKFTMSDGILTSDAATISVAIGAPANQPPTANSQSLTTKKNTPLPGKVTGSDPEGQAPTFNVQSQPTLGTLSFGTDGTFTYSPLPDKTGTDSFTFTAFDGSSPSAVAKVTIVVGDNLAPTANPGSLGVAATGTTAGVLTGVDPEKSPITFTVVSQPAAAFGTVTALNNSASGNFTFTPALNASGSGSFTFKVNDGVADSAVVTFNLTINTAPVANATSVNVTVGDTGSGQVSGSDVDVPKQNLTFIIKSQPDTAIGTLLLGQNFATDGSFAFKGLKAGVTTFTYVANDGLVDGAPATVTLVVNGTPVADAKTFAVNAGTQLSGILPGSDTADDVLVYTSTQPASGTVVITNSATGAFTYDTVAATPAGDQTFDYTVTDKGGLKATGKITLTVNTAPTATDVNLKTSAGTPKDGILVGGDTVGDTFTYAFIGSPGKGTVSAIDQVTGKFTYTPGANVSGTDSVTYTVTDSKGLVATAKVNITLNTAPDAAPKTFAATVGIDLTGALPGTDSDLPPDTLTFSPGTTTPKKGTVDIKADGSFTYKATAGLTGSDTFSYSVSDGSESDEGTITVDLNNVPVATPGGTLTVDLNNSVSKEGTLGGTDLDPTDTKAFGPGTSVLPTLGKVFINGDGTYTYVANASTVKGTDTFSFNVTDGKGAKRAPDATVTVTIIEKNIAPVVTPIAPLAATAGTPVSFTPTATDANVGDTAFTFKVSTPAFGTATVDANGKVTYTPTSITSIADAFTVTASDGKVDSLPVNVGVAINQKPIANGQSLATSAGVALTGSLTGSDQNGSTLTFAKGTAPVVGGSVTFVGNSFTFTPAAGFTGDGSFTFTASDGALTSAEAKVTVAVNAKFLFTFASSAEVIGKTKKILDGSADVSSLATGVTLSDAIVTISGYGAKDSLTIKKPSGAKVTKNGKTSQTIDFNGKGSEAALDKFLKSIALKAENADGSRTITIVIASASAGESRTQTITVTVKKKS